MIQYRFFSFFNTRAEIASSQLPALTHSKGHQLCCTLTVVTGLKWHVSVSTPNREVAMKCIANDIVIPMLESLTCSKETSLGYGMFYHMQWTTITET